jgi:hypothetical protein
MLRPRTTTALAHLARAIAAGMIAYLNGLPEPLYALFGTGHLGYTARRQWGKSRGTDR